ncbi:MAG: hypothetical protein K0R15_1148 [Clostridiales bacterium]|nr:hypothetical protein [Clostridiales bacterium]
MKIKKYQANTEKEAIYKIKEELGNEALILNIRAVQPKGFFRYFKKQQVEVTAAIDDNISYTRPPVKEESVFKTNNASIYEGTKDTNVDSPHNFQNFFNQNKPAIEEPVIEEENKISKNLNFVKLIYNQLINNEVDEEYANQLISEIENALSKEDSMDNILGSLYQKIVLKLGEIKPITLSPGKTKIVFIIGPTGVGKTTTIAKIASKYKLNNNTKVAFITADTYRIAAVEQLRTYANILNIPMSVIYSDDELTDALIHYQDYDLVIVDTAGRSHRNEAQCDSINEIISMVEEKEVFLVLSATTKYKDLVKITDKYSGITNYKIIFTKLDETSALGNILNIKMLTGADLSYVTYGQNVPMDICELNSQQIAKHLLGGADE